MQNIQASTHYALANGVVTVTTALSNILDVLVDRINNGDIARKYITHALNKQKLKRLVQAYSSEFTSSLECYSYDDIVFNTTDNTAPRAMYLVVLSTHAFKPLHFKAKLY